ncbi:thioesterase II family protein [Burkholderia ubonensis]|nr:alpha/beta fold hydrolase [Burkholderia ubonensis]
MTSKDCIRTLSRGVDEQVRLICFPHAGAGASIYHAWTRLLPSSVGVYGVQLAGREQRIDQPFVVDWAPVIEEIRDALAGLDDKPFSFYGHSLGGLIAYEVASALQHEGAQAPQVLVAGGSYAPSAVRKEATLFDDEAGLMRAVHRLGGVDDELIGNVDFIHHFLPVIAADFTLFNRYTYDAARDPLDCPVVALFGTRDADHGLASATRWRAHTRGDFQAYEVDGGHFFHRECARETVDLVTRRIRDGVER